MEKNKEQNGDLKEADEISFDDLQAAADFLDAIGVSQEEYDNSPMGLYSF